MLQQPATHPTIIISTAFNCHQHHQHQCQVSSSGITNLLLFHPLQSRPPPLLPGPPWRWPPVWLRCRRWPPTTCSLSSSGRWHWAAPQRRHQQVGPEAHNIRCWCAQLVSLAHWRVLTHCTVSCPALSTAVLDTGMSCVCVHQSMCAHPDLGSPTERPTLLSLLQIWRPPAWRTSR